MDQPVPVLRFGEDSRSVKYHSCAKNVPKIYIQTEKIFLRDFLENKKKKKRENCYLRIKTIHFLFS